MTLILFIAICSIPTGLIYYYCIYNNILTHIKEFFPLTIIALKFYIEFFKWIKYFHWFSFFQSFIIKIFLTKKNNYVFDLGEEITINTISYKWLFSQYFYVYKIKLKDDDYTTQKNRLLFSYKMQPEEAIKCVDLYEISDLLFFIKTKTSG
jgi:hypothetical protein